MAKEKSSGISVGLFDLLTLLFIGLKLGKVIDWSWWAVLSPLWFPIVIGLTVEQMKFLKK